MNASDELVYPEFNGLARLSENMKEVVLSRTIEDWDFNYADYEFIGTITTSIESHEDSEGDVVGIFVDDQCRGVAERMYFSFDDRSVAGYVGFLCIVEIDWNRALFFLGLVHNQLNSP